MSDIVLSALHTYLILAASLGDGYDCYPHYIR